MLILNLPLSDDLNSLGLGLSRLTDLCALPGSRLHQMVTELNDFYGNALTKKMSVSVTRPY